MSKNRFIRFILFSLYHICFYAKQLTQLSIQVIIYRCFFESTSEGQYVGRSMVTLLVTFWHYTTFIFYAVRNTFKGKVSLNML